MQGYGGAQTLYSNAFDRSLRVLGQAHADTRDAYTALVRVLAERRRATEGPGPVRGPQVRGARRAWAFVCKQLQ
jgi:hypothetical protein